MAIKVFAREKAWQGFLRRAKRAFPKEHIEAVWGEETVDSFRITDFRPIRVKRATPTELDYDDTEMKRQKWEAEREGKTFLGTVHTHPRKDFDTAPSAADHHQSSKDEKIMGVVVLYKKPDSNRFVEETDWWFPQKKIEFTLF